MKRESILNLIGLLLLLVCFLVAIGRVFTRGIKEADPSRVTIRFAHWQLESGIRDAFDELARLYMELHPGVEVIQVPIPERIYSIWMTTQLIGETAPDLIQLGMGTTDDRVARFFVPYTDVVEQPNPYNVGTELEGVPWRDTFIDGLASAGGQVYFDNLLEIYGIPSSMFTVRIYYNRDLYRRIFGHEDLPESYEEFLEVCRQVEAFAERTGEVILPISGSKYNAPHLMVNLHRSQMQRFVVERSPLQNMEFNMEALSIEMLDGSVRLDQNPLKEGFLLMREIGQFMPPGFLQLNREDATFYFVQGRALMISTGSWDAGSLMFQSDFELGAFAIPFPSREHPIYGPNLFGPNSEAGAGTGAAFGLTRYSRHRDVALDFLHFITSRKGNEIFAQVSKWLPSVVGVEPAPIMRAFMPVTEGYPPGTNLADGPDRRRVLENHYHILVDPNQSLEAFLEQVGPRYRLAILSDLQRTYRNRLTNIQRQDSLIPAYQWLARREANPDRAAVHEQKISELRESQIVQEISQMWIEHEVKRSGVPFNP